MSKLPTPNVEHRATPRRPITLDVHMATGIGAPLSCTMHDVSELGARIAVDDPLQAPQEFLVLLSDTLARWCRVIWRSEHEIGIAFVGEPESVKNAKPAG
jgi:hypothetical protein